MAGLAPARIVDETGRHETSLLRTTKTHLGEQVQTVELGLHGEVEEREVELLSLQARQRIAPVPAGYDRLVDILVHTGCIDEPSKIWWDVRPHPKFPTLEFRVADICTRFEDALCLTALIQALVAKLIKLRRNNQSWRRYPRHLITENKWRAVRHGIDGPMIDFGKREEVPLRILAIELLDFLDDVVDELGSRREVEHVHRILEHGTSADRQLATFRETGSLEAVVDRLAEETIEGCV